MPRPSPASDCSSRRCDSVPHSARSLAPRSLCATLLCLLAPGCLFTRHLNQDIASREYALVPPDAARSATGNRARNPVTIKGAGFELSTVYDPTIAPPNSGSFRMRAVVLAPADSPTTPGVIYTPKGEILKASFADHRVREVAQCLASAGLPVSDTAALAPLDANLDGGGFDGPSLLVHLADADGVLEQQVAGLSALSGVTSDGTYFAVETRVLGLVRAGDGTVTHLRVAEWVPPPGGMPRARNERELEDLIREGTWRWLPERRPMRDCRAGPPTAAALNTMRLNYLWSVPLDVVTMPFQALWYLAMGALGPM